MARPKSTTEKRTERVVPVTFTTVAEKKEWQQFAKDQGQTLAGLIKALLVVEKRRLSKP